MRVAALVPAAGAGTRLGRGPKAFVEVAGLSLLERAVRAFEPWVDETLVAVSAAMREEAAARLGGRAELVLGGGTRQESVYNLLLKTEADLVLIHDAARPFLPVRVVRDVIAEVMRTGAATAAMPVADSLIVAATGETVDRARMRAVQTPQGFRRELILEAHRCARSGGTQVTDDAALVRSLGKPVGLVQGSSWLVKVTTPADLEMAEALATRWDADGATC